MEQQGKIEPHRITKPIQLLAAWLLGLILVNGAFLLAAAQITKPDWVPGALVIASIINVLLFLVSIFLLQTKFRPEMQEDSFYSKYLEKKTGNTEREVTADSVASIRQDIASLEKIVSEKVLNGIDETELQKLKWSSVSVMLNKGLPNFSKIAKKLSLHGIPVHETFGGGAGIPEVFKVAIGRGFDVDQIKILVETLLNISDGWISYAHDDDETDQYNNQVLIGAYGSYKHGIELSKIKPIINRENITATEVYKVVGK